MSTGAPAIIRRKPVVDVAYDIWICDDYGNRIKQLNNNSGFKYGLVLNDVGGFSITMPEIFGLSLCRKDAIIEIHRNSSVVEKNLMFLGLLTFWEPRTRGKQTSITLEGVDPNHYLERYSVLYDEGDSQATATAEEADDLMKRIVDENMGGSATDSDRDMSAVLSIAPDLADAPTVDWNFAGEIILDLFQDIAEDSRNQDTPLYFGIKPVSATAWEFQTRINQWGKDRTTSGAEVQVSQQLKNMKNPQLPYDTTDEVTVVRVLGQDDGGTVTTQDVTADTRLVASRFNRIERVIKGKRDDSTAALLTSRGQAELAKERVKQSFKCDLVETPTFVFGLDWDLGDKLRWEYAGQSGVGVVNAVEFSFRQKKETIRAHLETELWV